MARSTLELVATPNLVRQGTVVDPQPHEIWARSGDGVASLAEKVRSALEDHMFVDLAAMGAIPTNNAIKAVAEIRKTWNAREIDNTDIVCQPFFSSFIDDEGRERTRLVVRVFVHRLS